MMAFLTYTNGRKQNVSNDQALKIYKVLNNQAEPANEQQAAFCLTVADVHLAGTADTLKDEQLDIIMHDDSLYGLKKARAISDHLKGKR